MKKFGIRDVVILLAFLALIFAPSGYNFVRHNLLKDAKTVTYGQFYSEDLFEKIKKDIKYNDEWSIAFGINPSVLQYNGIATLDGYVPYYSMKYKKQFRELITPALDVDLKDAKYFDEWGARAYIFSNDVKYKGAGIVLHSPAKLLINPSVFKQMGGVYIFSRTKLSNADDLGIKLIKEYKNKDFIYQVYVYKKKG